METETPTAPPPDSSPEATEAAPPVRSGGMPAPKRLIVGVVAALAAVVGLVVAVFVLFGAQVPASASWVPADAPFYVDIQADLSDSQEEALGALLGRFPQVPDDVREGGIPALIDELLEASGAEYRYDADIGPWFNGQLAFAALDFPADSGATMAGDFVFLAGVGDAAAATAFVDRVRADLAEAGTQLDSETYEGTTIWSSPASALARGDGLGAFAVTGEQVIAATRVDGVKAVLDAKEDRRDSLADREQFRTMVAKLPADRVFVIAGDSGAVLQMESQTADAFPVPDELGDLGSRYAVYYAFAGNFAEDRLTLDGVAERPRTEVGIENARRTLADRVPADAILFADGGKVGESLAEFIVAAKEALPPAAESPDFNAQTIDQVEALLGNELEAFVSWAGDAALVAGTSGNQPYVAVLVDPLDADAAAARLGQLEGLLSLAAIDPSLNIEVTDGEHAGATITTVRFSTADLPVTALQWAVRDDLVIIAFGEQLATRVLDLDPAQSLGQSDRFDAAVARLGGDDNVAVSWIDLAAARDALEPILPPEFGMPYEEMIRPWVDPLDYLAQVSRLEGDLIASHAELVVR